MKRTQIYLTPAQHQYFSQKARQKQTSLSEEIRTALDRIRQKDQLKASHHTSSLQEAAARVRTISSSAEEQKHELPTDLAINHDHYVYGTPKNESA